MKKAFLKQSYGLDSVTKTEAYYRDWAASYDEEIAENGYQTPQRCAEALARHCADKTVSILDIGCGTGLSGIAFKAQGFSNLHGNDLSQEMLDIAAQKQIYQSLHIADLHNPLDFDKARYDVIAAVGVISVGHAPPSTIAQMFDKLGKEGLFVFSINDASIAEGSFTSAVEALLQRDDALLCEDEYGTHLPKIDMKSIVYVIKKTA
ncbi:MAG: class I SAM-dependent DNA methyltransferase [Candidatus Puniceispirillaceae bacterium]